MIEVSINNAKKNFGFKNVFDDLSLEVKTGERVALIGVNGSGKSTLLKVICGEERLDTGKVSLRKGISVGMLSQIPPNLSNEITVGEFLLKSFERVMEIEKKLRDCEIQLATVSSEELESVLKVYGRLQEEFDNLGGYTINEKMSKICTGFKISNEMLMRSFNMLSGGEKTIVSLAALIIQNPDLLLLDEPTNHLDIDTLEWFEQFLNSYKGTVIISSHDRYFLDKVVTKTVLIERGQTDVYNGNYSYYLNESERRALAEFDEYKNQQKQIDAMKETVRKLKEWGERGDNPRFFKRALCIERKLEKMELLDRPEAKKQLPLDFDIKNRSGKDVLVVKGLGIILGDRIIFDDANLYLKYGEKVCLMGKNGTGKSTLIKAIINGDNYLTGEIKLGSNVSVGYMPQEIKFENEKATVLDVARDFYEGTETHLRASLAKFLFYGDNVFKKVEKLSGGEKVRLKLFCLMQKKANLLILDEPTNHIDIDTKEMLEEALAEYQGTLFFISHDRYFINKLAQRILNIENNIFEEYLGNYDDYKEQKNKKLVKTDEKKNRGRR